MANLTIKNVPEPLHRALKKLAEEEGRSLNAHIIYQLEVGLAETSRRRRMRSQREQFRALVDSLPAMPNSAELIREDRDRGHR
jgi:plasmid stability protein